MASQPRSREEEPFACLLLQVRGRTGLTQRDLATRLGASMRSVQDWESGVYYPNAHNLKSLIAVLLDAGGLSPGRETAEAEALWAAAQRESERMQTPFDASWFAKLLGERGRLAPPDVAPVQAQPSTPTGSRAADARREYWGDAPDVLRFLGRTEEVESLQQWLGPERCRLVAVLGRAGSVMPGFP